MLMPSFRGEHAALLQKQQRAVVARRRPDADYRAVRHIGKVVRIARTRPAARNGWPRQTPRLVPFSALKSEKIWLPLEIVRIQRASCRAVLGMT